MRLEKRLISMERKIDDLVYRQSEKEGYFDVKRSATFASVSVKTVRRWIGEGRLPGYKPDGKIFVKRADIDKLIEMSKIEIEDIDKIIKKFKDNLFKDESPK